MGWRAFRSSLCHFCCQSWCDHCLRPFPPFDILIYDLDGTVCLWRNVHLLRHMPFPSLLSSYPLGFHPSLGVPFLLLFTLLLSSHEKITVFRGSTRLFSNAVFLGNLEALKSFDELFPHSSRRLSNLLDAQQFANSAHQALRIPSFPSSPLLQGLSTPLSLSYLLKLGMWRHLSGSSQINHMERLSSMHKQ